MSVRVAPVAGIGDAGGRDRRSRLQWRVVVAALLASTLLTGSTLCAENNDPEALFQSGRKYFYGQGAARDDSKAFDYFRQAAEKGHAKAEHNLAVMYLQGRGVKTDPAAALSWFKRAADQGIAASQDTIGQMALSGTGMEKSCEEAKRWLDKAAAQNYVEAEVHLARVLFFGADKCEHDYAAAAKWLSKAADAGDAWSQNTLGFLYQNGFGVPADKEKATEWFRRAAEQGDAKGEANYGAMLAGATEHRDLVRAYAWFKLSADQGEATGSVPLGELKKGMTPAQVEEGERLAREQQEKINASKAATKNESARAINTDLNSPGSR